MQPNAPADRYAPIMEVVSADSKLPRVQELAVPAVLEGKDVVLAAETGSGKTLAYLTPIATALLEYANVFAEEDRT